MFRIIARDSFRGQDGVWGGDKVKTIIIPWMIRDKYLHAICGFLTAAIAYLLKIPPYYAVNIGGILVELIELTRFWLWYRSNRVFIIVGWQFDFDKWWWYRNSNDPVLTVQPSAPWVFADSFSVRDLIANNLGALPIYIYALLR